MLDPRPELPLSFCASNVELGVMLDPRPELPLSFITDEAAELLFGKLVRKIFRCVLGHAGNKSPHFFRLSHLVLDFFHGQTTRHLRCILQYKSSHLGLNLRHDLSVVSYNFILGSNRCRLGRFCIGDLEDVLHQLPMQCIVLFRNESFARLVCMFPGVCNNRIMFLLARICSLFPRQSLRLLCVFVKIFLLHVDCHCCLCTSRHLLQNSTCLLFGLSGECELCLLLLHHLGLLFL